MAKNNHLRKLSFSNIVYSLNNYKTKFIKLSFTLFKKFKKYYKSYLSSLKLKRYLG